MVESQPSKLLVAGSIPVSRSRIEIKGLSEKDGVRAGDDQDREAQEFAQLREAIEQVFQPAAVERFLKQLDRKGIRIRDFDAILAARCWKPRQARRGLNAKQLYGSLTLSDQAQMREFYLSKLESVDQALRHKFKKLYQYY